MVDSGDHTDSNGTKNGAFRIAKGRVCASSRLLRLYNMAIGRRLLGSQKAIK